MSDEKKLTDPSSGEVLVEKVREIEAAKSRAAKEVQEDEEAKKLEQRRNTARILGEKIHQTPPMDDNEARRLMGKYSRRNFLIGGAAAALGVLGYRWLRQPEQTWIFERGFKFNENLAEAYFSPARLAPEFPPERIGQLRVNGGEGMSQGFDPAKWRLQVLGVAGQENYPQYKDNIFYDAPPVAPVMTEIEKQEIDAKSAKDAAAKGQLTLPDDNNRPTSEKISGLLMTLDDIKALPRVEMITELKCIEGWSVVTHWAGARFSDFAAKYGAAASNYVSLVTPDGGYYVGMDMQSMLHPQTLLCYEMNYAPLAVEHGAPLRLVTPTKYGIKQIKRIGRIIFTDERPKDFWAESGYDWYSGH